ncbi:MAG: YraN family protein [Ignavibacteriales bacterium]|nr:YraN family protein [Ignavibacteriales bacterium]MCF8369950.1 YraN family protein [Bacteroidales bacterium]MCF8406091.1 YraN family protein [Bacteroidales bacterium]
MAKHYDLGIKGEEIATRYLKDKSYEILERNWRHGKDEIDIIALDGKFLVIVEVKTRSTNFFGEPEEAVTSSKQKFLVRAAEEFILEKNLHFEIRFDIISIIIAENKQTIRHIQDAFYPELYD